MPEIQLLMVCSYVVLGLLGFFGGRVGGGSSGS